jgi:membrane protein required for colicin V production
LNGFDAFVIVLVLIGAYRGYKSGFLMEVVSLLGIVAGLLAGFKLVHIGVDFLKERTSWHESFLPYAAFGLIFVIVIFLVLWLGKSMKSALDKTLFGTFDQAVGALTGVIKTIFLTSVFLWIATSIYTTEPAWLKKSLFYPHLLKVASLVSGWAGRLFPTFRDVFLIN